MKGETYTFDGYYRDESYKCFLNHRLKKHLPHTKNWNKVAEMVDRCEEFCVCAFVDKPYVIGGHDENSLETSSCAEFDVTNKKRKMVSGMGVARRFAACAVYQEKNCSYWRNGD